ncbi:hypothetical protein LCGC14_0375880 [marine sediment metagenome]|uniref:Uncharacterized protein n=1 Tax=marine sediment metagenome TaxID=412755 RepID=A0A0F9T3P9_9ZZZZ
MPPKIAYHAGQCWFIDDALSTHENYYLVDVKDDSKGKTVPRNKCRVLEGDEYRKQLDAIRYLRAR